MGVLERETQVDEILKPCRPVHQADKIFKFSNFVILPVAFQAQ